MTAARNSCAAVECRDRPVVSVLMAVRNGEPYLRKALESIRAQTFGDFELVVVDDASSDHTVEIVRSFRDPRFRVISCDDNVGPAKARNLGLQAARGQYVAALDADDTMFASRLMQQVRLLEAEPALALVCGHFDVVDDGGRFVRSDSTPEDRSVLSWQLVFGNPVAHSTLMYRKAAALAVGGYDEVLDAAEDYALIAALAREHEVACVPGKVGQYREHAFGRTSQLNALSIRHAIQVSRRQVETLLERHVDAYAACNLCCRLAHDTAAHVTERERQRQMSERLRDAPSRVVDAAAVSLFEHCLSAWLDKRKTTTSSRRPLFECLLGQVSAFAGLSMRVSARAHWVVARASLRHCPLALLSRSASRCLALSIAIPLAASFRNRANGAWNR